MNEVRTYKDLLIWAKGMKSLKEGHILVLMQKKFQMTKLFGITSPNQAFLNLTIPSNNAEDGSVEKTTKNYIQF